MELLCSQCKQRIELSDAEDHAVPPERKKIGSGAHTSLTPSMRGDDLAEQIIINQ